MDSDEEATQVDCNEAVYAQLVSSGVPGTEWAWPVGNAPDLPWFVYYRERGGETFADNSNWASLPRFVAELYMKDYDSDVRAAFETAISEIGPFSSNEGWIPSENCFMVSFSFTYHQ